MQSEGVVTTVRGDQIKVTDVIAHLKYKGIFRTAIYELIEKKVIEQAASSLGVLPSPQATEQLAAARRQELGVVDDATFDRYLKFYGVSKAIWLQAIRFDVTREAVKNAVISQKRVVEAFKRDPARFATVSIARIVCRNRNEAEHVAAAARSGQEDFLILARDYSTDENTRMAGGFIGNVTRGILPSDVDGPVFAARNGDILGPFWERSLWTVYKVYTVNVPRLNDALKVVITDQLFAEWLREQVCTVPA